MHQRGDHATAQTYVCCLRPYRLQAQPREEHRHGWGDAIARILRQEGFDFIGCVPYQPLLEAAAIAGIRPIIFRQEGTGIHM
jgi:hypothetical protein